MTVTVTPTTVTDISGGILHQSDNPLHWAISNLDDDLIVEPGNYAPIGTLKQVFPGLDGKRRRVSARVRLQSRILRQPGGGTTIYMDDGSKVSPILFDGLFIEASSTQAFTTYSERGPYIGVDFHNCTFDGGYDWTTGTGHYAKWGIGTHRWQGSLINCVIQDIAGEHGFYPHSIAGDVLIRNTIIRRTGRGWVQCVGRENEAGFSPHRITIDGCRFEDCGLNDGGSGLTLGGVEEIVVKNTRSSIGLNVPLREAWEARNPGRTFGTGHLVNWSDMGRQKRTDHIWINNYAAVTAPGCGSATVVKIANSDSLNISQRIHLEAGGENKWALTSSAPFLSLKDIDPTSQISPGKISLMANDD